MTKVTDQQPNMKALGGADVTRPAMTAHNERVAVRSFSAQHVSA